jgi:hypothetical protein
MRKNEIDIFNVINYSSTTVSWVESGEFLCVILAKQNIVESFLLTLFCDVMTSWLDFLFNIIFIIQYYILLKVIDCRSLKGNCQFYLFSFHFLVSFLGISRILFKHHVTHISSPDFETTWEHESCIKILPWKNENKFS